MNTIKQEIIRYIESQGHASKSKIEDYLKDQLSTTGDCMSRRLRELVASNIIRKDVREYQGKKYFEYSVAEEELKQEEFDCTICCRPLLVCKCD